MNTGSGRPAKYPPISTAAIAASRLGQVVEASDKFSLDELSATVSRQKWIDDLRHALAAASLTIYRTIQDGQQFIVDLHSGHRMFPLPGPNLLQFGQQMARLHTQLIPAGVPTSRENSALSQGVVSTFRYANTQYAIVYEFLGDNAEEHLVWICNLVSHEISQAIEKLTLIGRVETARFKERMAEQAEALFFYREVALGIFHQLGNHAAVLRAVLSTIRIVVERFGPATNSELPVLVQKAEGTIHGIAELIAEVQKRAMTLKPIPAMVSLIRDVLRPALDYAKNRIESTDIRLAYSLTNREYIVLLDRKLAIESVINVLVNGIWAIKQNRHGGRKEIFIAVREDQAAAKVRIEITDSGIGMERDIFEKVALCSPFTSFREGGTGLGLYFARNLFTSFGGTLSLVRSQPGKGTTVELTLPIHRT